jgi:alpha-L-arabinofuranosidase
MLLVSIAAAGLAARQEYVRHTELEGRIFSLELHAFCERLKADDWDKERVVCMSKFKQESYNKEARYEYMKKRGCWECFSSGCKFDDWDAEAKWYEDERDHIRGYANQRLEEAKELRKSLLLPFVFHPFLRKL